MHLLIKYFYIGVRLKDTVLLNDSVIKAHTWIEHSIIGWKCSVGKWVQIFFLNKLKKKKIEIKLNIIIR